MGAYKLSLIVFKKFFCRFKYQVLALGYLICSTALALCKMIALWVETLRGAGFTGVTIIIKLGISFYPYFTSRFLLNVSRLINTSTVCMSVVTVICILAPRRKYVSCQSFTFYAESRLSIHTSHNPTKNGYRPNNAVSRSKVLYLRHVWYALPSLFPAGKIRPPTFMWVSLLGDKVKGRYISAFQLGIGVRVMPLIAFNGKPPKRRPGCADVETPENRP